MVDPGKGNAEVVEDIAELLEAKKNVFLNGGAGTGRSELVKQIVKPPDEPASILQTWVCSKRCAFWQQTSWCGLFQVLLCLLAAEKLVHIFHCC